MSEQQACEVPLIELLRAVPADYRACIEIQWAEDGTPTGHRFIPVGVLSHRAADEIERQRDSALSALAALKEAAAKVCFDASDYWQEFTTDPLSKDIPPETASMALNKAGKSIRALPIPAEAEVMARDAAKWRAREERRRQLIDAGFCRSPLRNDEAMKGEKG